MTIFTSASLLFFVQPLFTRIVLPSIGGASAVWTTAMLFFQSVLIAGYLYAHLSTQYLSVRWQMGVHLALWALALWFLPLALPSAAVVEGIAAPAVQTLILYALGVGVPFAVLSANAPLIQSWYGRSGGPSADDPYFLYGASNLGSLISLLAFPLIAEPFFGISVIGKGWAVGFVALGALLLACGLMPQNSRPVDMISTTAPLATASSKPKLRDYATWALLAFIPSSLMLGVTSKISTDFGSFPMVWVIPLALYLLTFVISFTNRPLFSGPVLQTLFRAGMAILVVLSANLSSINAAWMNISLLIVSYFIVSTMAHSKLFSCRPNKEYLTLFYLTMSVGGALGGMFNSILAPIVFNDIYELRVVVAFAAFLLVVRPEKIRAIDLAFGALAGLIALLPSTLIDELFPDLQTSVKALSACAILFLCYQYLAKRGFASVVTTYVVIVLAAYVSAKEVILRDRSFFGVHMVQDMPEVRRYVQGTTIHGAERLSDFGKRPTPITYYIPTGPMGQIFLSHRGRTAKTVGIVGLGVGALACYRQPGQAWDFYEIDKVMDDIARNPNYFTFMSSCAGEDPTHIGDARIELEKQIGKTFDILVIDAYSSDAVPVHLTTVEAMALYRDRLAPGGLLIFHISNRYFDIDVPLARSAKQLGLQAWIQRYEPDGNGADGQNLPSTVVAVAKAGNAAQDIAKDPRWTVLESDSGSVWTDDYANPLSILRAFRGSTIAH
jgi:SAM-dependent methyltransferase